MLVQVQNDLRPNEADMREHVEHLFGGYLNGMHDGLIELSWSDPEPDAKGRYPLRHAQMFETDQIDELIAKAVEVNMVARTNVYIGATLRKPGTTPFARGEDDDFYAAPALWADLDDRDANDSAKANFAKCPPSLVVRTGTYPHWRHHLWWRLSDPMVDGERVRAAVSGIASAMRGDSVGNPSRVMRLAGTIAWDQKPGRIAELTSIIRLSAPGLPAYLPEHVEGAFPPLWSLDRARIARAAPGPNVGVVRASGALGLPNGKVVDGRERHMVNVICARLIDWCGRFGSAPTADELFEHAWPAYEQSTDLTSRPGRGRDEFLDKCRSTARRFEQGRIRGVRDVDEAIATYQTQRTAKTSHSKFEAAREGDAPSPEQSPDVYEFLDIPAIKALPNPAWIVEGIVIEDALGFIYGPPGHGKTFVALNLALHVAAGMQSWWWGRGIARNGLVLYIAREGVGGLKTRIEAWQRAHGVADDTAPFALIRSGINFMDDEDVHKLIRTVDAAAEKLGATPAMIFVDTVSRVLPGAEENLQKDMTLFVSACDALREKFRATVVGVHHAGKSGDMRGSTVLKGAGDFVLKVERPSDDEDSTAIVFEAEKIKDAEDGWRKMIELRPVEWVEEGRVDGERKSLVAMPVEEVQEPALSGGWPTKDVCRAVLRAVDQAWTAGRPWSPKVQTRDEGRYAPRVMSSRWNIAPEMGVRMVEEWQINGVLAFEMVDKKTKMMGLKVIGSIDV